MRADEFTIVEKKRRKRKPRWAAYGPGPYGGYGFATGYSGAVGGGDGGGGVGEASYPGNLGMMELAKFFQTADDDQKKLLKQLLEKGKKGLAWKLIQDVTGIKLQGKEFQTDEGWKDWVGGAALGATVAAGGLGAYDAHKDMQQNKEPASIGVSGKVQDKSNFEKGIIKIAKDAVPKRSVTDSPHEKLLTNTAIAAGIKGEELAQFLAQTAHETGDFKHMVEIGGSLDFRKYEPKFVKDKKGNLVQVNPKAKTLGNTKKGDGARYKGRGYIQLTGKYNYKRAGQALGLDLVNKPELVEKPEVAAKVAVWFWQNRVQPRVDDFYDTRAATKPINSGLKGLEDRKEKFKDFKTVMK
jgi:predicted chitinase